MEHITSIKGLACCLTYFGGSAESLTFVCCKWFIMALSKADKHNNNQSSANYKLVDKI